MKLEQTFETREGSTKKNRIFTITLSPKETMKILDSPAHLITPKAPSGTQFQIVDRGDVLSKEDLAFRPIPGEDFYFMAMPTGFKDNQAHLDYLVSLGDVPMLIPFEDKEIPVGYVRFKAASPS